MNKSKIQTAPAGGETTEPRPPLGSWGRMYLAVLLHLAFWVGVFYLFTDRFAVSP
jgi:hypothetical protein